MAGLLFCSGCLFPLSGLSEGRVVRTDVGDFLLKWKPDNFLDAERSARAVESAAPKLVRWGKLKRAVTFSLLPSHLALESAVRRFGFEWLHAWAQYDEVYFQSPTTWGASDPDLDELVLHEVTHCLMYQRSATKETWGEKQIPLWFREGMAMWTAKQGDRGLSLEDVARFYEKNPGSDPLTRPEDLMKDSTDVVYAAAHDSFTFLVRRYGEPAVNQLMDSMFEGRTFPEAFLAVTGITADAFAREFRHYILWRGFKRP